MKPATHYSKKHLMKTKMIRANFAVKDLKRTTEFYTNLGFKSNRRSNELTSFFFSDNNFLHFFLTDILEKNIKVAFSNNQNSNEIIFTLSADTTNEVEEWAKSVRQTSGKNRVWTKKIWR